MSKTHFYVSMAMPSGFIMFLTVTYSRKQCTVGRATVLHYAYISYLVFKMMWCMLAEASRNCDMCCKSVFCWKSSRIV